MKFFATISLIGVFLLLAEIPDKISAYPDDPLDGPRPHEVWSTCGTWCESTCDNPTKPGDACIAMCKIGYFCEQGYIRATGNRGDCISLSECEAIRQNA